MRYQRPYHARPIIGKLQTLLLTGFLACGLTVPVQAQCERVETSIIPLRTVAPEKNLPWARTLGLQGMDRFLAASAGPKDTLVLWGESQPYNLEAQKPGQRAIYRVVLDAKGKLQSETRLKLPQNGQLQDIVRLGKGMYALDKMADSSFILRRLDADGRPRSALRLDGVVTTVVADGENHALLLGQDKAGAARLQRIALPSGKVDWTRIYMPGTQGQLHNAVRAADGSWAVMGQTQRQGWYMALNPSGAILAQRQYPRGKDAVLQQGVRLSNGDFVLAGVVVGGEKAKESALWVMRMAANGDMRWQRYLTGAYALAPVSLQAFEDGRITLIANAVPTDPEALGRGQVRRLIFDSRGTILGHQALQAGVITTATMAVAAQDPSKSALVLGATQTGFVEADSPPDLLAAARDAWVVALPPLPTYTDPCLSQ